MKCFNLIAAAMTATLLLLSTCIPACAPGTDEFTSSDLTCPSYCTPRSRCGNAVV